MARIIAPNGAYDGVSASVRFSGGAGETDDPHLIGWFREHGYSVEADGSDSGGGEGGKGGGKGGGRQERARSA
jgi:hypothetical protein